MKDRLISGGLTVQQLLGGEGRGVCVCKCVWIFHGNCMCSTMHLHLDVAKVIKPDNVGMQNALAPWIQTCVLCNRTDARWNIWWQVAGSPVFTQVSQCEQLLRYEIQRSYRIFHRSGKIHLFTFWSVSEISGLVSLSQLYSQHRGVPVNTDWKQVMWKTSSTDYTFYGSRVNILIKI